MNIQSHLEDENSLNLTEVNINAVLFKWKDKKNTKRELSKHIQQSR